MDAKVLLLIPILLLTGCGDAPSAELVGLSVSPQVLKLTSEQPSATLFIKNSAQSAEALAWTLGADTNRIRFSQEGSSLEPGEASAVTLTFDYKGLFKGQRMNALLTLETDSTKLFVTALLEMKEEGLDACGSARRALLQTPAVEHPQSSSLPYRPGELLVRVREPAGIRENARVLESLARDYNLHLEQASDSLRPSLLRLPDGADVRRVAARLERDPRVVYAEPNYYLRPLSLPQDPLVSQQWSLLEFGLPEAWELQTGALEVVVAVIDSGIDRQHEDLQGKLVPGCDFYSGDNDPGSRQEHGTHVAGIIAARGNNDRGVAGVAFGSGVKLLPIKVFGDDGAPGVLSDLLDALLWAAGLEVDGVGSNPNPASIINLSLGIEVNEDNVESLRSLDEVAEQLHDRGVIMIAASGNDGPGERLKSPANSPFVITVGSVDEARHLSSFSSYASAGRSVDFVAPGGTGGACQAILSTLPDDAYGCLTGTSMAAPFVTGVVALLLSQHPQLTPEEVRVRLAGAAWFDGGYMTTQAYGNGVVCADRVLGAPTRCGQ